jgi:hypothetical protein
MKHANTYGKLQMLYYLLTKRKMRGLSRNTGYQGTVG